MHSSHQGGMWCCPSLSTEIYASYLEFCMGDLSFLYHLFIQSVILFTSLWTYGFLFCTLDYNPTWFSFVAEIILDVAVGSSFSLFLCLFWQSPIRVSKKKEIFLYLTLGDDNSTSFHEEGFLFFLSLFFLAMLYGIPDLSSSTRDQTCVPCSGSSES